MIVANGFTRRQIAEAITPRIQELIILPTEKCNLRCTYCYEDFELGKMSDSTQLAVERLIEAKISSIEELRFSWFGGEPLLAKHVVLRLSRFAKRLCDERGVRLKGGLTTNGYALDKDLAEELIGLNQDFYQITLDGWAEGHDQTRKRADGKGTFDVIWRNLVAMRTLPLSFEVCIRIHVRRDNFANLEKLVAEIAKAFKGDSRFVLDFQHVRDMGGEGGRTLVNPVTRDELPQIATALRDTYLSALQSLVPIHAVGEISGAPTSAMLMKSAASGESAGSRRSAENRIGEPYICYAGRPNSLLIRSNGRLGKCTVALDDDRNDIGYLAPDGRVHIDPAKLRPWLHGLASLDEAAAGCPLMGLAPAAGTTAQLVQRRTIAVKQLTS